MFESVKKKRKMQKIKKKVMKLAVNKKKITILLFKKSTRNSQCDYTMTNKYPYQFINFIFHKFYLLSRIRKIMYSKNQVHQTHILWSLQ